MEEAAKMIYKSPYEEHVFSFIQGRKYSAESLSRGQRS